MQKQFTFTGIDGNGINRVYAIAKDYDLAESMCRDEATAYVKRRPDTGPLSHWSFKDGAELGLKD